jgi:hypothetical protein
MFYERVDVEVGEVVDRGRFVFVDVALRAGVEERAEPAE